MNSVLYLSVVFEECCMLSALGNAGKRNIFQLEIFHTCDVSIPVNSSSFPREIAELCF